MSKSVRNTIIAAAVVVVVAVAAAPFILKGIKKDNNIPVDASVSETAAAPQDVIETEPAQIEEETTADVIDQILETMTQQQQQAEAPAQEQRQRTWVAEQGHYEDVYESQQVKTGRRWVVDVPGHWE